MHQRKLGPFSVSAIGLGCMNIVMGYGPAERDESLQMLRECLDAGYSFLDTAAMYGAGRSEELVGEALAARRGEYVLATKCGLGKDASGRSVPDGRPDVIKAECDESLRRLRTDVIDLYYLHRIDRKVPVEESVGAMAELVAAGKVRTLGLSEVCTETVRRAHAVHPITAIQSEYSVWTRTPERGILALCDELDIAFVPFSPMTRSFFTGVTRDATQVGAGDIRATIARPRFEPENFERNQRLMEPFRRIADAQGCSPAQLLLAWVLARHDRRLIPIPGTRSREHMRENALAGDIVLDGAVVAQIDELINEDTVAGRRYTDALMAASDAERD